MHRRTLLTMIVAGACAPLAARAQDEPGRPRLRISAGELHEALAARFPARFGVPGLLELQVSAPSLHLAPARNKLGAGLRLEVSGAQARQVPAGEMDVVFALRYAAADQTVRAHDPEILDVRWPGASPDLVATLKDILPGLARNLGEIPLRKLTPHELALPDTMGFEPRDFQVQDDGLLVLFGPKPRG